MDTLNRHLLTIRCKQPYVAWANTTAGKGDTAMLEASNEVPSGYLVTARESDLDGSKAIRESWAAIFEHELAAWSTDEATWPPDRTLPMFREWFEVTFSAIVVDLGRGRIEVDDG